jgi:acetyl-CoA carboxylase biotin carboxyl carrier protein
VTPNTETEKNGNEGHNPAGNAVSQSITYSTPGESGSTDLESVCRSVTQLARSAQRLPSRIKLRHGSTTVEMEWPDPAHAAQPTTAAPAPAEPDPDPVPPATDDGLGFLCAPMVGTFYHAREPGAPPLVRAGDLVRPGQAVGILEVMKMMSTVEADVAGRVIEILVSDAQPVEFQQRLIAVETVSQSEGS